MENEPNTRKSSNNRMMKKDHGYYYNGVLKYFKTSDTTYFANLYRDHFRHTFISLQFCRNLKPPQKKDLTSRKSALPKRPIDLDKKTLVLD